MSDRELLEMAAKAAGIRGYWCDQMGFVTKRTASGIALETWDPLTDDGDALRLAVKLGIEPRFLDRNVAVCAPRVTLHNFGGIVVVVDGDGCAATRRAIVRAAAAIGESL